MNYQKTFFQKAGMTREQRDELKSQLEKQRLRLNKAAEEEFSKKGTFSGLSVREEFKKFNEISETYETDKLN